MPVAAQHDGGIVHDLHAALWKRHFGSVVFNKDGFAERFLVHQIRIVQQQSVRRIRSKIVRQIFDDQILLRRGELRPPEDWRIMEAGAEHHHVHTRAPSCLGPMLHWKKVTAMAFRAVLFEEIATGSWRIQLFVAGISDIGVQCTPLRLKIRDLRLFRGECDPLHRGVVSLLQHAHFVWSRQRLRNVVLSVFGEHHIPNLIAKIVRSHAKAAHFVLIGLHGACNRRP